MKIQSFAEEKWVTGSGDTTPLFHAVNGKLLAEVSSEGLDFDSMLSVARCEGGPALRRLTFHQRATLLKDLGAALKEKKGELYALSAATGATKADSWMDIDGGISTLLAYAGKAMKELPDSTLFLEGQVESLSRQGTFVGRHICVPKQGAAVHINAFNFPCWGMLEKLAPSFLAGMPSIVKPATLTCYVTEALVRTIIESGILPAGTLQLICGNAGDLLEHLTSQDVVTFTGSAETARRLRTHPRIVSESVRFNAEADSLNCSILGPDVETDSPEFQLFVREVTREMTMKAGQKCTAIRRVLVPRKRVSALLDHLSQELGRIRIGDPAREGVGMGPLAGKIQAEEVAAGVEKLSAEAEFVLGGEKDFEIIGDCDRGAFFPVTLFHCAEGLSRSGPHQIEAFGPVSTVMPFDSIDEAIQLAALGKGSLVGSLVSADRGVAAEVVRGISPYHGRFLILDRECASESTGHGTVLPGLVHGGPGRAGGGEELGGVRGILHFMQRTALQGSPGTLERICEAS